MKGGHFLVSTKDVLCSEKKNTENKSLIQEGFPIDASVNVSESNSDAVEEILLNAHTAVGDIDDVTLSDDSRQILTTSLVTLLRKSSNIVSDDATLMLVTYTSGY